LPIDEAKLGALKENKITCLDPYTSASFEEVGEVKRFKNEFDRLNRQLDLRFLI